MILLPTLEGAEKTGADDFLVHRGVEALTELKDQAPPWRPGVELLRLIPEGTTAEQLDATFAPLRRFARELSPTERSPLIAAVCERWQLPRSQAARLAFGSVSGRPQVQARDRALPELVEEAWGLLLGGPYGEALANRHGRLVEVHGDPPDRLQPVNDSRLGAFLCRSMDFVQPKKDALVPTRVPPDLVRDMLAMPSDELPLLDGLHTTPIVDDRGGLLLSGHHERTRSLIVVPEAFEDTPDLSGAGFRP